MPASPSAAQLSAMQQAMSPAPLMPDRTLAVSADRSVSVDFTLPRFGVSLLTFQPSSAADPGSGGATVVSGAPDGGCACDLGGADPTRSTAGLLLGLVLALTWRRASRRRW